MIERKEEHLDQPWHDWILIWTETAATFLIDSLIAISSSHSRQDGGLWRFRMGDLTGGVYG